MSRTGDVAVGSARWLYEEADRLARTDDPLTRGLWSRASALLARMALEVALDGLWARTAPSVADCPMRTQLLCLPAYLGDRDLALEAATAWTLLSRAGHHHAYELPLTAAELRRCLQTVDRVVARTDQPLPASA